jgi:hypothetical protein
MNLYEMNMRYELRQGKAPYVGMGRFGHIKMRQEASDSQSALQAAGKAFEKIYGPNYIPVSADDFIVVEAKAPAPADYDPLAKDDRETLYLPLGEDVEALVTITIKRPGPGALDRPERSKPTVRELHDVTQALQRRVWQFHPIID